MCLDWSSFVSQLLWSYFWTSVSQTQLSDILLGTEKHVSANNGVFFENKAASIEFYCGLVVGVLGYRSRGPGSIPCATRFSKK
jgi:hypothetical protein